MLLFSDERSPNFVAYSSSNRRFELLGELGNHRINGFSLQNRASDILAGHD